jgi:hypothetical protein
VTAARFLPRRAASRRYCAARSVFFVRAARLARRRVFPVAHQVGGAHGLAAQPGQRLG